MRKKVVIEFDRDDAQDMQRAKVTMYQFLTEARANYSEIFGVPSFCVCLIEMKDGRPMNGRMVFNNKTIFDTIAEQHTLVSVDATGLIELVLWSTSETYRHFQVLVLDRDRYNKVYRDLHGGTLSGAPLFRELAKAYSDHRLNAGWADHYFTPPEDDRDVIEAALGCYW